jgi:hypothetical protein
MKNGVILIGPDKIKSTVGKSLAASLGLPFSDLSNDAQRFRKDGDADPETVVHIYQAEGYGAVIRYLMPQRAHVVERALAAYGPSVVALGAFHTIFDDDELLRRVQQNLVTHPANRALATATVYTEGKTPAETCREILSKGESHERVHRSEQTELGNHCPGTL